MTKKENEDAMHALDRELRELNWVGKTNKQEQEDK